MKDDPAYIERLKLAALRVSTGSQQGWQDLLGLVEEHEARTDARGISCQSPRARTTVSPTTTRAPLAGGSSTVNKFRPKPLYGRKPR
jgi:hypothetical protein